MIASSMCRVCVVLTVHERVEIHFDIQSSRRRRMCHLRFSGKTRFAYVIHVSVEHTEKEKEVKSTMSRRWTLFFPYFK